MAIKCGRCIKDEVQAAAEKVNAQRSSFHVFDVSNSLDNTSIFIYLLATTVRRNGALYTQR